MSAAPPFDGFEEREQPALGSSLALALAVHLVLFAILFVGIRWESHPPAAMVVELWPAMPEATPKPAPKVEPPPPRKPKPVQKVEPPPPPKLVPKPEPRIEKPDIAIKAPPKPKPPPPKPEPKPKPKPKPKPEPKPKPRDDAFKKQMEQQLAAEEQQISAQRQEAELSALLASEAAAARNKALAAWADKIRAAIRSKIVLPLNIKGNPEAQFQIVLLPTAEVLSVRVEKSSGNSLLDDAIIRAIRNSSPLPKPEDKGVFQRRIDLTYRPFDKR